MLHNQHIRVDCGKAVGGDFLRITHTPTGVIRSAGPPLGKGKVRHEKRQQMLKEIEEELLAMKLTEYIWHRK